MQYNLIHSIIYSKLHCEIHISLQNTSVTSFIHAFLVKFYYIWSYTFTDYSLSKNLLKTLNYKKRQKFMMRATLWSLICTSSLLLSPLLGLHWQICFSHNTGKYIYIHSFYGSETKPGGNYIQQAVVELVW